MKTILILAYECAPFNKPASTIGAQRPYNFAKYLPNFGYQVIVLTCDFNKRNQLRKFRFGDVEGALLNFDKDLNTKGYTILPLPSLRYAGLLDFLWKKLNNSKYEVYSIHKNSLIKVISKLITFFKLKYGDYSQSWQRVAYGTAKHIFEFYSVDLVIAEHGPDASLHVARKIYKNFKIPWIADFRDPVLQPYSGLAHWRYKSVINKLLKTCSATINVTEPWARLDKALFNLPAYTITNGFDEEDYEGLNKNSSNHSDSITIGYMGGIKKNQDIELWFKALSGLKKININKSINFLYVGPGFKRIEELALKYHVNDIVEINSTLERNEAFKLINQCHYLLLYTVAPYLTKDHYFKSGFYPGKLFEYIGFEKPILAIPGDNGIADELILKNNFGAVLKNVNEITDFLTRITNNPRNKHRSDNYDKFSRRETAKSLSNLIDKIICE